MHHFTFWTWMISRFNRTWLHKDLKVWNCQHMPAKHSWIGIKLVNQWWSVLWVQVPLAIRNVKFVLFTKTSFGDHSPSPDSWTRMNLGLRCNVLTLLSPLTSCSIVKALLPSVPSIQPSSTLRQRKIRPKLLAFSCSSCFAARFFIFLMSYWKQMQITWTVQDSDWCYSSEKVIQKRAS